MWEKRARSHGGMDDVCWGRPSQKEEGLITQNRRSPSLSPFLAKNREKEKRGSARDARENQ